MMTNDILDGIPVREQRQDSVSDQLRDLCYIANRLGMRDAADAIGQMFTIGRVDRIRFGCHCDIENTISGQPDDCVLNTGDIDDCIYAKRGMRPEQCEYWRPIKITN